MDESSFTLFSFMSLLCLSSMFPIPPTSAFNSTHLPLCHDDERSALLQFKESFIIDKDRASSDDPFAYLKVESWKLNGAASDCCSWDGVECDHLTGNVIGLDLSGSYLYGSINSSSSLFRLVHLRELNLAFNHFNYSQIPPAVGLLSKLLYMNMSNSFLSGPIPSNVTVLSSLSSLDLSFNYYLSGEISKSIGNLNSLTYLNLDHCVFSGKLKSSFGNLTKLSYLFILNNAFDPQHTSSLSWVARLTKLVGLGFDQANLYGEFPSLFANLTQLSYLSLIMNELTGPFPTSLINLTDLTSLSLSYNRLQGSIPQSISQLRNLEYLNLQGNSFSGTLEWDIFPGPFPTSLINLTDLTFLDLSYNRLQGSIPKSISQLRNLESLNLQGNSFSGTLEWDIFPGPFPSSLINLTDLTTLDLSYNRLQGSIPKSISQLRNLEYLNLQGNSFSGTLEWDVFPGPFPTSLINLTGLTSLDLSYNRLQGSIPKSISQLRNLEYLDLQGNSFSGTLEWDIFLKLEKLQRIYLSANNLTLIISTRSNNTFQKFLSIGFAQCKLNMFPDFLRYQDKLEYLELEMNSIAGQIPKWLWNMSTDSLQLIDLSSNFLTGFEAHPIVFPWVKAAYINLYGNMLQSSPLLPPASIETYLVSGNKLTGEIPLSFCNLTSLHFLDMADNHLSGRLPSCLGNFSTHLEALSLWGNDFYGKIPLTFSSGSNLRTIRLSYNQLQGEVPRSLSNCTMLEFLDIGNNQIRDVFPSWLGPIPHLKVLILRSNQFHGVLTGMTTEFDFQRLRIIDLSRNNFTGQLPTQYLFNWVAMKALDEDQLTYMEAPVKSDKKTNFFSFSFVYSMWITSKGTERGYDRILEDFVVIDLSCNRFEGDIPGVIGSLQGLRQLNLSHNNLRGDIPSTLANLTRLESLDLSQNKLSGEIPQQLAQLNSLEVFNVSHNLLAGPIPQGKQFNTFQNDSYQENLGLCGNPLSRKCGNSEAPPRLPPAPGLDDEDDSSSLLGFGWEAVAIGYASGLVFGLVMGYSVVTRHFEWFARVFRVGVKGTRSARNIGGAGREFYEVA